MSAAMYADIKELKARVSELEERVLALAPEKPELSLEQQDTLNQRRHTLKLSLKRPA